MVVHIQSVCKTGRTSVCQIRSSTSSFKTFLIYRLIIKIKWWKFLFKSVSYENIQSLKAVILQLVTLRKDVFWSLYKQLYLYFERASFVRSIVFEEWNLKHPSRTTAVYFNVMEISPEVCLVQEVKWNKRTGIHTLDKVVWFTCFILAGNGYWIQDICFATTSSRNIGACGCTACTGKALCRWLRIVRKMREWRRYCKVI